MQKTIIQPSTFAYSLKGCVLTSIEREKKTCRLIFLKGIHKGREMTDGYVEVTQLYHDSYLECHNKKTPIKNIHHLDLLVDAFSIGDDYLYIKGEDSLLVLHYAGKCLFQTTF